MIDPMQNLSGNYHRLITENDYCETSLSGLSIVQDTMQKDLFQETFQGMKYTLCHIVLQWNLSIMVTLGATERGCYREVTC